MPDIQAIAPYFGRLDRIRSKPLVFSIPALLCLVFISVSAQVNEQTTPSNWLTLDAGPFSILAPSGWKFHQLPSVDSYVGEFVGGGVSLRFDFGRYSSDLKDAKEPDYIITRKSIDGFPAKIVSPSAAGHGITGVYFGHVVGPNALCLWGRDLTEAQQNVCSQGIRDCKIRTRKSSCSHSATR